MTHNSPSSGPSGASSGANTSTPPRWVPLAALVVAVIAVGLAIVGWFRPPSGPGSFNGEQTAEAKTRICTQTTSVRKAVGINTHRMNPTGDGAGALGVMANARLALYGGGAYLQNLLDQEPATPDDLAKAVGAMANTIQELGINYLADAPDTAQQPLRDELNSQIGQINELCQ
jgi:hypothetical protein